MKENLLTIEEATLPSRVKVDLQVMAPYMPVQQLINTIELMRGEEGNFFIDTIAELANRVRNWDPESDKAILHYFGMGYDWLIIEPQRDGVAFGWANLGDPQSAEYGSIYIPEILQASPYFQLDYHWTPVSSEEAVKMMLKKYEA